MRADQLAWNPAAGWSAGRHGQENADLIVYFGSREALACGTRYRELREMFPKAHILGCTTGGQIRNDDVTDEDVGALALQFEATSLRSLSLPVEGIEESYECGLTLGEALSEDDLAGVFVLCDGVNVNGSALVAGICKGIGERVPVVGGMAGDGASFTTTLTGCNEPPRPCRVAGIGFYGNAIRIGHGHGGGWSVFGPRRNITRAQANVLYELDGEPALDLYERYLGDEDAMGLPGTALLYPIKITDPRRGGHEVVRGIHGVDRNKRSIMFAGDVPTGWTAQLMRGNFDQLVAGAAAAARDAREGAAGASGSSCAAILVSCIARRMLMGQRIIDEIEAAAEELGDTPARLGFYSYGEIAPHAFSGECELHNQTMTAIVIGEATG